jgi:hypothetical protein
MMAYVPKPNTGTLWPTEKKTDSWPDVRGDLYIERGLLKLLAEKHTTEEGLVKISVSGWKATLGGKKCLSLKAGEPYVAKPKAEPKPEDESQEPDEDLPF